MSSKGMNAGHAKGGDGNNIMSLTSKKFSWK